jgi:hypothetical protein
MSSTGTASDTGKIGNEPDLYQNRNNQRGGPAFDVDWYNAQFRAFHEAMKAGDLNARIAGPVVTGGWQEWMPAFIRADSDIVDVLSWHWYPQLPPELLQRLRISGRVRVHLADDDIEIWTDKED